MSNTTTLQSVPPPHDDTELFMRGNTTNPGRALVLCHGRGAPAESILALSVRIDFPDDVVLIAPEAHERTWYPHRFIEKRALNEPHLGSALAVVGATLSFVQEVYGVAPSDVVLAGFSQGACLIADFAARHLVQHAGLCIFSGGVIGSEEEVSETVYNGDMEGTPVYIGSDEEDAHIPRSRVEKTTSIFRNLGADVTERLYTGLGHTVHPEGLTFLENLLK